VSSLRFHERMSGWISFDELSYNQAARDGKRASNSCSQELEIEIDDLDRFLADRYHTATVTGTVSCDQLGGRLEVTPCSTFNMFVPEGGPRRARMLYRLYLRDGDGRELTLRGFKELVDDPNLDIWSDTTTLFVRLLRGRESGEPQGAEDTVATGILYISRLGFLRQLASMRGSDGVKGIRTVAQLEKFFVSELVKIYAPAAETVSSEDWPSATGLDNRWQGHPPGVWHDLPGTPGLQRRIIGFDADDPGHTQLTLHHIRSDQEPTRGPVLMVPGCGVRANLFYGAPRRPTIVETLVRHGYDVWVENWRGSIDLPPMSYTLDQAAVYDHPAAVRTIRRETGASEMKSVIHCQGSTSMMMSLIAGLVPEITTVVSNAVSLHVNVPLGSKLKALFFVPPCSLRLTGVDAQWAVRSPSALASGFARMAKVIRARDCDNEVCHFANYMYGVGPDLLWRHANIDSETHEWISREFGFCPLTLLSQLGRSQRAGHLVPVSGLSELPENLLADAPKTEARITFLAGSRNRLFLPVSQRRSFEYFDDRQPGRHSFYELPGYTHLDVMFGRNASADVFPLILRALDHEPSADRPGVSSR
jgi:hypothetical protein